MFTLNDLLMHCNPNTLATIIADLETQDDGCKPTVRDLLFVCDKALTVLVGKTEGEEIKNLYRVP